MGSVAVIGAGNLGSIASAQLASSDLIDRLYIIDSNQALAEAVAMDARYIAFNRGRPNLEVEAVACDLTVPDQLSRLLESVKVDVWLQVAAIRSWYGIMGRIPGPVWNRIYAQSQYGPWLPINMVIPLKFARAIEQAGIRSHVVNVSNPEIVNAILGRLGIEPICGSGNSENLHTVLRYVAARMLDARHERILVRMIAHHNHVAELDNPALMEEAPFWYAVELDGRDVTADLDARGFLDAVRKACPHNRAMCGASSSVKNVLRLLDTDTSLTYCSSPLGRAGGRDVRMSKAGLEIVLPAGMSEEKADAIIDAAQRREGIERIGAEGEVEFVGSNAAALAEWLGYDCKVLYPDEAEERAYELLRKIDAFCERGFTPAKAG